MIRLYKFFVSYNHIIIVGLSLALGFYCVQNLDKNFVIWYLSKFDDLHYKYLPWYKISFITYIALMFLYGWFKVVKQFFISFKSLKNV